MLPYSTVRQTYPGQLHSVILGNGGNLQTIQMVNIRPYKYNICTSLSSLELLHVPLQNNILIYAQYLKSFIEVELLLATSSNGIEF
jgi:hypothetical protein